MWHRPLQALTMEYTAHSTPLLMPSHLSLRKPAQILALGPCGIQIEFHELCLPAGFVPAGGVIFLQFFSSHFIFLLFFDNIEILRIFLLLLRCSLVKSVLQCVFGMHLISCAHPDSTCRPSRPHRLLKKTGVGPECLIRSPRLKEEITKKKERR